MSLSPISTRAPRSSRLNHWFRQAIVRGEMAPGDRIPTRRELMAQFDLSNVAVNRALQELAADGFVVPKGSRGTFVAESPPHVSQIGIVFSHYRPDERFRTSEWSLFDESLYQAIQSFPGSGPIGLDCYLGAVPLGDEIGPGARRKLHADLLAHRLGGIVFTSVPHFLFDDAVILERGTPKVAVMQNEEFGIPAVWVDQDGFCRQAAQALRERGRSRLADIQFYAPNLDDNLAAYEALGAEYGFETRTSWLQTGHFRDESGLRQVVRLLLDRPSAERPDALIVHDDNLVGAVMAAVEDSGLCPGSDLDIVAHTNFPLDPLDTFPVIRLGFDAREILQACIEVIQAQWDGKEPPPLTVLPCRQSSDRGTADG